MKDSLWNDGLRDATKIVDNMYGRGYSHADRITVLAVILTQIQVPGVAEAMAEARDESTRRALAEHEACQRAGDKVWEEKNRVRISKVSGGID